MTPIIFAYPILYKMELDKLLRNKLFIICFFFIPISLILTSLIPQFRDLFFQLENIDNNIKIKSSTLRYILFYYMKFIYLVMLLIIFIRIKKTHNKIFIPLCITVIVFLSLSLEQLESNFLGTTLQLKLILFFFLTIMFYFITPDFDTSFKESKVVNIIFSLSPIKLFIGFIFLEIIVFQLTLMALNYIIFDIKSSKVFSYTVTISFFSGLVITFILVTLIRFFNHYIKLLKKTNMKLNESNNAKSLFMANISHEIRNPISGMIGISSIIKNKVKDSDSQKYISELIKTSNNLMVLIDDILDFSKSEIGILKLNYSTHSLKGIIDNSLNIIKLNLEEKKLKFHLNISPSTPDLVYIDSTRLSQVIINILSNSIKFTDKGHINMSVSSYKYNNKHYIKIKIEDTGIGIKKKYHSKIFDKFFQIDNPMIKNYKGSGLGLSISKSIVKAMKGKINFKSSYGKGTTFEFSFLNDTSKLNLTAPKKIKKDPLSIKILIAEDDLINRTILIECLKSIGCKKIDISDNGQQALDKMIKNDYDIAFLDVQMPIMDGISAIKNIREKKSKLPVFVIITANKSDYLLDKCKSLNIKDIIIKPIKKYQIERSINIFT